MEGAEAFRTGGGGLNEGTAASSFGEHSAAGFREDSWPCSLEI